MATGDPGHHGIPALSPAEVVVRLVNVCAMTLHQTTVAKIVLVKQKTSSCVTRNHAPSVRHFNHLQSFYMFRVSVLFYPAGFLYINLLHY